MMGRKRIQLLKEMSQRILEKTWRSRVCGGHAR